MGSDELREELASNLAEVDALAQEMAASARMPRDARFSILEAMAPSYEEQLSRHLDELAIDVGSARALRRTLRALPGLGARIRDLWPQLVALVPLSDLATLPPTGQGATAFRGPGDDEEVLAILRTASFVAWLDLHPDAAANPSVVEEEATRRGIERAERDAVLAAFLD